MIDCGHWIINEPIPADAFGFIYEIVNTVNNKKYIGKKQMRRKIRRQPLKGKKRCRIEYIESDWKTYTGSSDSLNADIIALGMDSFTFNILKFYKNKFELAYYEAKMQFDKDVLLNELYYNGIINVRLPKKRQ